ncbi:unnamed protein product [Ectocarpus sp. 4 AP-2014]
MSGPRRRTRSGVLSAPPQVVAVEFDSSRPDSRRPVVSYQVLGQDEGLVPQNSWNRVKRFQPSMSAFVRRTFLPTGYPSSVRKEYMEYQTWDTVQALCSYLRGVLCLTAMLHASGVGDENASAIAAAMVWVLRDGFGMIGSLLFSYAASSHMDSNIKEWRLFADIANDVGLTLDLVAPVFRGNFAVVSSLATVFKALCGVAAGCTKTSITSHFALKQNMADISAKENAQETAVNVCGMLLGVKVASYLSDAPTGRVLIFVFFSLLHVYANYRCVSALHLDTLNKQRAMLLVRSFVAGRHEEMRPELISVKERVWIPLKLWWRYKLLGGRLASLAQDRSSLLQLKEVYGEERFMAAMSPSGCLSVVLNSAATPEDMLKAYFLCVVFWEKAALLKGVDVRDCLERERCLSLLTESHRFTQEKFGEFVFSLRRNGWDVDHPLLGFGPWRCDWELSKGAKDE